MDQRDIVKMNASELLYYDPNHYKVDGYTEPVGLQRLVDENARAKSARYASRADWRGVDPRIKLFAQVFCKRLVKQRLPFHVQEAMRSPQRQRELYEKGFSKIKTGGKHPAGKAVDIVHSTRFWNLNKGEWAAIMMLGHTLARDLAIPIRNGGDWDSDGNVLEHSLYDPAHWELID